MKQATPKNNNNTPELWVQFSQRLREGLFLITLALSLYWLIALWSYHGTDPGWSSTGTGEAVQNAAGRAGAYLADFFLYLFGYVAYVLPFIMGYFSWIIFSEHLKQSEKHYALLGLRWVGAILVVITSCALLHISLPTAHRYLPFTAGGIVGNSIGNGLNEIFSQTGSVLLLLAVLLGGVTWCSGVSWINLFQQGTQRLNLRQFDWRAKARSQLTTLFIKLKTRKPKIAPPIAIPSAKNEGAETLPKTVKEPRPAKTGMKVRIEPGLDAPGESFPQERDFDTPKKPVELKIVKPAIKEKPESKIRKPITAGGLPSLSLLNKQTSQVTGYSKPELEIRSREVEQRLADFGVVAQVVSVHPGPVVTRFELALAPGVKASKLTGLARDLARSLSIVSVRVVEIIPGKSVVGLELPNESRAVVGLREVFESSAYEEAQSPLSLALGKDIAGDPIIVDLAKMPHLLVAGTTGSGKSVGVNAMLLSLLYKASPEEVRLILVDPKMLELAIYEGIPHLLAPVVTDMKEAASALRWCVAEMERRYRLMASLGVRNLLGYNQKIKDAEIAKTPLVDPFAPRDLPDPVYLEALPYIVVIIDEFADMMMVVGKKVEQLIARIAQKARAAGIHLILATQRPSVDVITGLIKANIPTRISFQVSSKIDSRTIIDQQGAEQLLGHGDMLYLAPGSGVPVRVHGAFVADHEVHNVVNELKKSASPTYVADILSTMDDDEGGAESGHGNSSADGEQDPLYDEVLAFVVDSRRASVSSVQRRFKIGYNRAARIVEALEQAGVVSHSENGGAREVLVSALPRE